MIRRMLFSRVTWVIAGIAIGLGVSALIPQQTVQATATDRGENFAIATGSCDGTTDAIFTLDFLTGDLRGAVIHPVTKGLAAVMQHNVLKDLKVEAGKQPKFLIVTAACDLRSMGGIQMAQSILCVTELGSGVMALYGFHYSPAVTNSRTGTPAQLEFLPLLVTSIRNTQVRGQ
ncbi:MAG: hypothetical protein JSS27_10780 [Planctomycetes bacterium]|nr:hypothetical protein [Planctomycetota bacterium]